MNQYLKAIQDLLQQNSLLSEQEKDAIIKAITDADKHWSITDFKLDRTEKVKKTTAILLEETISELEQKRKAVEAQNRELEIESSLERVRARAMAMQKSDELKDLISTVSTELGKLDIVLDRCFIITYDIQTMGSTWWMSHPETPSESFGLFVKYNEYPPYLAHIEAWKERKLKWQYILEGEVKETFDQFLFEETELSQLPGFVIEAMRSKKKIYVSSSFNNFGYLALTTNEPLSEEQFDIMLRFAKVFDLTYTRFNDLKQAEAQARESQIQLAMERVRARTMAMQHSDELADASFILDSQVRALGIKTRGCAFNIYGENESTEWFSSEAGTMPQYKTPRENVFLRYYEEGRKGKLLYIESFEGDACAAHYDYLCALPVMGESLKKFKESGGSFPAQQIDHVTYFKYGYLLFITLEPVPDAHDIFKRFAAVFEQTYTRFLDLQKAEAQAREAKIEAALEKVRSRSLGMHKSDELYEVVTVVSEKLRELDVAFDGGAAIVIFTGGSRDLTFWIASNSLTTAVCFRLPYFDHPMVNVYADAAEKGIDFFDKVFSFEDKNSFYIYAFEHSDFKYLADDYKKYILESKNIGVAFALSKHSAILTVSFSGELISEQRGAVLKRFSRVFEQAYTRFLDLQKAEAQAREAQIEASLERVRAKTMAMHSSEDVTSATETMFEEFKKLGIDNLRCGIANIHHTRTFDVFGVTNLAGGNKMSGFGFFGMDEHPIWQRWFESWENKEEVFIAYIAGQEKEEYFNNINNHHNYLPQKIVNFPDNFFQAYYFEQGSVWAYSLLEHSEPEKNIMKRFATSFSLTFRRYQDLQKAEAQAKEAQIDAALERVRTRAMAMHKSDDLKMAVATVFEELDKLNLGILRCGIAILDSEKPRGDIWVTVKSEQGSTIQLSGDEPLDYHPLLQGAYDAWLKQEDFSYALQGEELAGYYRAVTKVNFQLPISAAFDAEIKDQKQFYYNAVFQDGSLFAFLDTAFTDEAKMVMKRFANVFNLTYKRFLDLQKAEAQAREAQIEVSLERVRSKTMAMHNSQEVGDTVATMFDELVKLGVETVRCGVGILHEPNQMELWTAKKSQKEKAELIIGRLDMTIHPLLQGVYNGWKNKDITFSYDLNGKDLVDYFTVLINSPEYHINYDIASLPQQQFHNAFYFSEGALFVFSAEQLSAEASQIFKRFAGVFGQTYRRYLDLQKAEANAREAQIEASLEKVRSRSLAMHNSDELQEVVNTVFERLKELKIEMDSANIAIFKNGTKDLDYWIASPVQNRSESFHLPYFDFTVIKDLFIARESGVDFFSKTYSFEEKNEWFAHAFRHSDFKFLTEDRKAFIFTAPAYTLSIAFAKNTGVQVNRYSEKLFSEEEIEVLKRFTKVFEQAYIRFLDLQKAEAQAREAKIETALERVRARTMAMQKSDELDETNMLIFRQLESLDISLSGTGIHICYVDKPVSEAWMGDPLTGKMPKVIYNHTHDRLSEKMYEGWKKGETLVVEEVRGEKLKEHFEYILPLLPDPTIYKESNQEFVFHIVYFTYGFFVLATPHHCPTEHPIFIRFAKVFEQTYTRFLDLQKAEAQVKEATIEAALEKVRGKAMAMHNSNDLSVTASMVFTELRKLGINPMRCGVGILTKENRKALLYSATASDEGDSLSLVGWVLLDVNPVLKSVYDHWSRGEDYFPVLTKEMLKTYYEHLKSGFTVPDEHAEYEQHGYFLAFSEGMFYGWAEKPFTESEIKILKRFATVIDLTFRRYMELQKSEANARDAVKQAALDRVRAEIASMRTIHDLDRITPLIWNELNILGIPFIRCGVFIMDESQQLIHTFLSTPDGKAIAAFHLPFDTPGHFPEIIDHWRNQTIYVSRWSEDDFISIANVLVRQGAIASKEQYLNTLPKGGFYLHFLPFLQGLLYVGNTDQLGQEEIILIQHVADAFSTAYARYEDFNKLEAAKQQVDKTLVDLKQAQTQLVQSEKMASLGELTAGIAHEIQNPLNFVNNFSDVSNELLEEMKTELEKGNAKDAIAIAKDVTQNLEKILYHGKRADAIVKGMLQHSRTSSGQREPTDINALADEYLRLAYHGLRAKEKSFNARFETDFDNSIGKINIIPQEIGRVVLNLINNAFYAASLPSEGGFSESDRTNSPTVWLSTKKIDDKVLISVKDNGPGISQKILDKIFQPFFTTKPTGQGTGLGLSLAYDIIKAHSGELTVTTEEGHGTEFIIQLPVKSTS